MFCSDIHSLQTALTGAQSDPSIRSLLLFGSDQDRPSVADLEQTLALNHKPLIGGIFPEIIADGVRRQTGFVLIPMRQSIDVHLFESTSGPLALMENKTNPSNTVLCFLNAFWPGKLEFLNHLYDAMGPFVNYVGGGAGSLSFQSMPCVFANQTIAEHAAVVGLMSEQVSIGVAHGWHPISDVIKVTKTRGNTILSLNSRPAFEVYRELVNSHSNMDIRADNFFDIAKSYPLGLVTMDAEMRIRDPYATEDGALHIVDEVPEGEYIRIMHGDLNSLLDGAKHAMSKATNDAITMEQETLCIDCISRVLFMQDDFGKELAILNGKRACNGILSIGEIANPGHSSVELFNKTIVVARWEQTN